MIFGNKKTFAVECNKIREIESYLMVQACFYINGKKVGDSEGTEVSGSILLAIDKFLEFSNLRAVDYHSDDMTFNILYQSMYGIDWRIGMDNNYRDRYSIHDIFLISIGDQGILVYLLTFPGGKSRILFGSREGKYFESVDVCEKDINGIFFEIRNWINEENI